ncbi:MAG TPA: MBL fold metallo-hydrolase, partial [Candidatus Subteraquimicrobiales bacterium]
MTVESLVVGELQTNCYIISSGAEAVIIDPGAEPQQILDILKSKGLNLKYIINTHGHFDHV